MVQWTDFERTTIQDIFSKIDYESVGHQALTRYIYANMYYQTQRNISINDLRRLQELTIISTFFNATQVSGRVPMDPEVFQ